MLRARDHVEQQQSLAGALLSGQNRRAPWPWYLAARFLQGYESPEEQVCTWNLKSQVKNRYRRMRRMEDAVTSAREV
uniref:Uncharacterized protein n=1 Tax=Zea mays TaxID=4577 RepID=B6T3U3_MAIZE|nr:hypothetical protein [Zea mays]ACG46687.1 hypothetical protein [Zea mays]